VSVITAVSSDFFVTASSSEFLVTAVSSEFFVTADSVVSSLLLLSVVFKFFHFYFFLVIFVSIYAKKSIELWKLLEILDFTIFFQFSFQNTPCDGQRIFFSDPRRRFQFLEIIAKRMLQIYPRKILCPTQISHGLDYNSGLLCCLRTQIFNIFNEGKN
jgi:hypothetical protein